MKVFWHYINEGGNGRTERDALKNIGASRPIRCNPVLADIFGQMGYMERQSSGFRKITEAYYAAHNYCAELEPKFYSESGSFLSIR